MGLETASGIWGLTRTNPDGADAKSNGDDHLRLIKGALLDTFPAIAATVTATHTELNYVDGVTSAIQTQIDSKSPVANPTFTGTANAPVFNATSYHTAPTEAAGSNNTRLATTEFVQTAVANAVGGASRAEMYFYGGF